MEVMFYLAFKIDSNAFDKNVKINFELCLNLFTEFFEKRNKNNVKLFSECSICSMSNEFNFL